MMLATISNLLGVLALVAVVQSALIDLEASTPIGESVLQSTTFEYVQVPRVIPMAHHMVLPATYGCVILSNFILT